MNGKQKTQIIKKSRCNGSDHHLCVADTQKLGHNKPHCPHNRRAELAACGSHCLHCPGKLLFISGLLHQRYGNGSGGRHIGNGRAIDHSHKSRGKHRYLCWSAGCLSYQGQGKIIDKLRKTTVFQKCPKHHKQKYVGSRNTDPGPQHPLGSPELSSQNPL